MIKSKSSKRELFDVYIGGMYLSFWIYVPDDLPNRAIYIFRSHLDYHARPDGNIHLL